MINAQIADGDNSVSGISTEQELSENLKANCVPPEIMRMSVEDYPEFLNLRRKLWR